MFVIVVVVMVLSVDAMAPPQWMDVFSDLNT